MPGGLLKAGDLARYVTVKGKRQNQTFSGRLFGGQGFGRELRPVRSF